MTPDTLARTAPRPDAATVPVATVAPIDGASTPPRAPAPPPAVVLEAATRAAGAVAPLWPLRHFVAVNPFLGLADQPFAQAARTLARTMGARLTMPRAFYADAVRDGRVSDAQLAAALAAARTDARTAARLPDDVAGLRAALAEEPAWTPALLPTVTQAAAVATGVDWATLATERISTWAAAHFDDGQAAWHSPWRDRPPYEAWHAEAVLDRTPEVLGARGFRAAVRRLPATAREAIPAAVARLGVAEAALDGYLARLLATIGGWAAYARYRVWERELHGEPDDTLLELLAVRLAWEVALLDAFAEAGIDARWAAAREALLAGPEAPLAADGTDALERAMAVDQVLHAAYEAAWGDALVARLSGASRAPRTGRPEVQAAFCIDVRSEVYRRALERQDAAIETIGFAGFFGFPIEYVPLGQERGGAQCPVLLTPKAVIPESVRGESRDGAASVAAARMLRRRAANAWKAFKTGAVSCFGFVGPVGLAYARKLVTDGFGLTRTVAHPSRDGIHRSVHPRLGPNLAEVELEGRSAGLAPAAQVEMADTVLRAMSMTRDFARLVVLAGHGSTTVNNPHATGLDCGACGGHTGEANARVAAAVLNDPAVRAGLVARGIEIPEDTIFVAALHDTTVDEVTLYDSDLLPASHAGDLRQLQAWLAAAGRAARAERAPALRIARGTDVDAAVARRSRDWSQVRPEWGLAGCAAFVAAPRHRTAGLNLQGRSFLHSYEWREDAQFGVLELIMTAPMVVASWISLQYYGSTVDNERLGCGNKVLHNVVGALGVLEGNGGDLRVGLPWQSVHDGERFVHEPLRLTVVIEAPIAAMNGVLERHAGVRALLDHGWLHLCAMDDAGRVSHRYAGGLHWEPVVGAPAAGAAA